MKKTQTIISSILVILICVALISGATYAIFTSESVVDVSVTSGKVDVTADILEDTLFTSSIGKPTIIQGIFDGGGTATFDAEGNLDLINALPGDKVEFNIEVENHSNVIVQYRVKWEVEGELYPALVAFADGNEIIDNVSPWEVWDLLQYPTDTTRLIPVSVELPCSVGNEYQEKGASITFTVEAVQGNAVMEDVTNAEQLAVALDLGLSVELLNDIVIPETLVVPEGSNAVIDLNGYTITKYSSGTYNTSLAGAASEMSNVIYNEGTLTVVGGTIESYGSYAIHNEGDLTVVGTTVIGLGCIYSADGTLLIESGNFYASARYNATPAEFNHTVIVENSKTVINGGVFDSTVRGGNNAMIKVGEGADVEINGGIFTTADRSEDVPQFPIYIATYDNGGKMTVNGGDFFGGWRFNHTAETTINGGTFALNIDQYNFDTHNLTIYGGDFSSSKNATLLKSRVANGFEAMGDDNSFTVAPSAKSVIVRTSSDLLALGNTRVTDGTMIVILADIDLAGAEFSAITVDYNNDLTIYGNGHTISGANFVSGDGDNSTLQASFLYGHTGSRISVYDLTFADCSATTTYDEDSANYAAVVVAYCETNLILDNVHVVKATVCGAKSSGAVVGHVSGSVEATNCTVSDTVVMINEFTFEEDGHYAGAFAGTIAASVTLNNCDFNATVTGKLHVDNVGAIYGRNLGSLTVDDD